MLGILLYLVAGIFGMDIFLPVVVHLPFLNNHGVTVGECVLMVFTGGFVVTIVTNVVRVVEKTKGVSEKVVAALQLVPVVSLTVAFLIWVEYSPSHIRHTHPVAFMVAAGLFYPACVERMVVCRLTKDPVPIIYPFTFLVFVGVLQAVFIGNPVIDVLLIRINAVIAILAYFHFAVSVIVQITDEFKINAFSINRPLQWPLKTRDEKKQK